MVTRRSFVKNGVRHISRWPSPLDILFYNNRQGRHLQSDCEPKCYKKVHGSYTNITPIFSVLLCAFWYIVRHNSCVCGYDILVHGRFSDNNILFHLVCGYVILVHGRFSDNNILFHLVSISTSFTAIY